MTIDGFTFDPKLDGKRLKGQHERVFALMSDGRFRTVPEIVKTLRQLWGKNYSETGVSARLRDLRKTKFGKYIVDSRRVGDPRNGLHAYRVRLPQQQEELELF